VLDILREAPGALAESYAGVAAVRIAGTAAFDDLVQVMNDPENLHSREGAAYGLASSHDEAVAPHLVRALQEGRIRPSCGAATLAEVLSVTGTEAYLRSGEVTVRQVALVAVFHALARRREDLSAARACGSRGTRGAAGGRPTTGSRRAGASSEPQRSHDAYVY
jgi:hypothetical protein